VFPISIRFSTQSCAASRSAKVIKLWTFTSYEHEPLLGDVLICISVKNISAAEVAGEYLLRVVEKDENGLPGTQQQSTYFQLLERETRSAMSTSIERLEPSKDNDSLVADPTTSRGTKPKKGLVQVSKSHIISP